MSRASSALPCGRRQRVLELCFAAASALARLPDRRVPVCGVPGIFGTPAAPALSGCGSQGVLAEFWHSWQTGRGTGRDFARGLGKLAHGQLDAAGCQYCQTFVDSIRGAHALRPHLRDAALLQRGRVLRHGPRPAAFGQRAHAQLQEPEDGLSGLPDLPKKFWPALTSLRHPDGTPVFRAGEPGRRTWRGRSSCSCGKARARASIAAALLETAQARRSSRLGAAISQPSNCTLPAPTR